MGVMVGEAEWPRTMTTVPVSASPPMHISTQQPLLAWDPPTRNGVQDPFQADRENDTIPVWPTSLPACRPRSPADESIVFQPGAEVASVFGLMVGSALRNEARTSHITSAGDKRLRATDLPASLGPIPGVWMLALSLSSPEPQKIGARVRKRAMVLNP